MAVSQNSTAPVYFGLSSDDKPTQGVPRGAWFYELDTNLRYVWRADGDGDSTDWVDFSDRVYLRRDSATGTDHFPVSYESAISGAIDLSDNASTTVYNGPCLLTGIWVEVTIATAAITIDDNATARMTVPAAITIGEHPLPGIIFESSLIVNPADTSTGTIRVMYRPLPAHVTWAY